jgi:hypothetical protein
LRVVWCRKSSVLSYGGSNPAMGSWCSEEKKKFWIYDKDYKRRTIEAKNEGENEEFILRKK